jgi:hypothetical protein
MSRSPAFLLAPGVLALALVGCVGNEAGLNIPTENLVERPNAGSQPITGDMRTAANGCFHVIVDDVSHFVVWPEGFRQDSAVVIGTDGSRYSGGDPLSGTGWVRSVDDVVAAADGPDGYMGAVTGYCAEEGEQVVVFESLEPAEQD